MSLHLPTFEYNSEFMDIYCTINDEVIQSMEVASFWFYQMELNIAKQ